VRSRMLNSKLNTVEKSAAHQNKTLLDVGAGTGYFLNHMQSNGWRVKGIEVSEDARKIAKDKFNIDCFLPSKIFEFKETFDVITLWHVLEHVHDLPSYLNQFNNLLNENGRLLIAVPNHTSFDAKHYKSYWAAYDLPRHLWHFEPSTINKLLSAHNFSLVGKKRMPYDAFYVSLLSEKYKQSSLASVRGGIIGFASWAQSLANIDKCSSLIYIFKKQS
ncbi:MAG: class I SAM-dependent methyltransferase, partial [Bacteroidota bacterium]